MKACFLCLAAVVSVTLASTAHGQLNGVQGGVGGAAVPAAGALPPGVDGGIGQTGLSQYDAWLLSRMRSRSRGSSVHTSPLVMQQAMLQQFFMQQQLAAAQAVEMQKQAKRQQKSASAKKHKADADAKRAASRAAKADKDKDAKKP